ncbi:MAG: cobalamin-dependent protein [Phycisphaerae bacterium]|jgi:methanogenic corrinoid protein MtbC1
MPEPLLIRYLQPLLAGRRAECFGVISEACDNGVLAEDLLCDVIWPAMAQVDSLYRNDRINLATEHMACRINRTLVDYVQGMLPQSARNGKRIIITCANGVQEETGAEVVADLLQADGWEVYLLGGGVPHDEILALVGQVRPEVLVIFGTRPEDVPETRGLVEMIRDIGVCPTMNIVVSGGIYNRADGLWQEVGADVFTDTAREIRSILRDLPPRTPNTPRVGLVKKRRRRRKAAMATA